MNIYMEGERDRRNRAEALSKKRCHTGTYKTTRKHRERALFIFTYPPEDRKRKKKMIEGY